MAEYIEKEAAIAIIEERQKQLCPVGMYSRHAVYGTDREKYDAWQEILDEIDYLPAADVRENVKGEWEERKIFPAKGNVDMLQSAFCPKCERYHTTPYSYFFTNYNFCPNCGADMTGGNDG